MNQETYIIIGLSVFAFLIGSRLKKSFNNKNSKTANKNKAKKSKLIEKEVNLSPTKEKIKRVFTIIILILVFCLLLFMIPALSRDLLSNVNFNQNLVLRILIVVFSIYILFMGFIKIRKSK
nr:hypothetical protein [uncultured Marinifilum sp.]